MAYINIEGDDMRFKNIYFFIFCVAIGIFLGNFMLSEYKRGSNTNETFNQLKSVTYFEQGIYNSKEEMEENTTSISYYIYSENNGKYYVYVGMTGESDNIEKLTNYFNSKGYSVNTKTYDVYNAAFLEVLAQYDLMLKESTGDTIGSIESQVLGKYEELVIRDKDL